MTEFTTPWKSMDEKQIVKFDLEKILLEGFQPEYKHLVDREVWWTWNEKQVKKTFVMRLHNDCLYEVIDMFYEPGIDHRVKLSVNLETKTPSIVEDNIYEPLAPDYNICKVVKEDVKRFDDFNEARKYFMNLSDSYYKGG